MALVKREYTDEETLITAKNLNEIQDAILSLEEGLFTVDDDRSGVAITITDAAQRGLRSLKIYGKTTQDGTPTPEAPVNLVSAADDSISVHVCGKNLFTGWIVGGLNPDTGITNTTATHRRTDYIPIFAPGQKYRLSNIPDTMYNFAAFYDAEKNFILRTPATPANYRIVEPPVNAKYFISTTYENASLTGKITEADAMASSTMIVAGEEETEHEIAKPIQTVVISTPNGLHGIPVTSGGNYTDANGQQWICDEIDIERGVYIKRVDKIVYDGSSDEHWGKYGTDDNISFYASPIKATPGMRLSLCDRFVNVATAWGSSYATTYGIYSDHSSTIGKYFRAPNEAVKTLAQWNAWLAENPTTLIYVMTTPIETPLTAEDLAACAAVHTYKDNTTVSNDGHAYMELEYVMDAKKYIDRLAGGGLVSARLDNVTLKASAWSGSNSLYSQVVTISDITPHSKVDLLPSVEQLAIFFNKNVSFVTENEDGVVTVYAIGDKPTLDYTMQVSITEVEA